MAQPHLTDQDFITKLNRNLKILFFCTVIMIIQSMMIFYILRSGQYLKSNIIDLFIKDIPLLLNKVFIVVYAAKIRKNIRINECKMPYSLI